MKKTFCAALLVALGACNFALAQAPAPNDSIRIAYYSYSPRSLCPGDTLTVTYTIINIYADTQLVSLGATLQSDSGVVEDKIRVKLALVPPGTWRCTRKFLIPENAASRSYNLRAALYDGLTAKELGRNVTEIAVRVMPPTDLAVSADQDSLVNFIGDSLQFACLVTNLGPAACPYFEMDYYLSSRKFGTEFLLGKSCHERICSKNATNGCNKKKADLKLLLPESITPGTYYITAAIDTTNLPWERNRQNNAVSCQVTVRELNLEESIKENAALYEVAKTRDTDTSAAKTEMAYMYRELGILALLRSNLNESASYLLSSLFLDPQNSDTKQVLAMVFCLRAKEYKQDHWNEYARQYWGLARQLYPTLDSSAVDQVLQQPAQLAVETKVQSMINDLVLTYCAIGKQYAADHKPQKARDYFSRALGLSPECAAARQGLDALEKNK